MTIVSLQKQRKQHWSVMEHIQVTIVNLQKQRMQHWSAMGAHSSDNCKLTKAKKATLECNGSTFK